MPKNYKVKELPLNGRLITAYDPSSIGDNFQELKNLRYTDTHKKGVAGMSKINTTALTTYLKTRNGFHFKKNLPQESHVVVQAWNTGLTGSILNQNTTAIPSAGDFSGTTLHADAASSEIGRFSDTPNDNMAYCNGNESLIWSGDEAFANKFLIPDSTTPLTYVDSTANIQNSKTVNASDYANIQTSTKTIYIGSVRPLQGIKFYVLTANTIAATSTIAYWNGSSWVDTTTFVDGTISSSKTFGQTGSMTFDDTENVAKISLIDDILLYWYKLTTNNLISSTSTVFQVTVDASIQSVKDIWDGKLRPALSFVKERSVGTTEDYTVKVFENSYDSGNSATFVDIGKFSNNTTIDLKLLNILSPAGVTYASNGTLWVCDDVVAKIYNITITGTLISSFATSVFDAGATAPQGISFAPDGTLWVSDTVTNKIYNITIAGVKISEFATSVFDAGATNPTGVSFASNGTLWVSDSVTDKIYNITVAGAAISSFATSVFDAGATSPRAVSYASDGTLWVCDTARDKIYNITVAGALISSFSTLTFDAGATSPQGISFAPDGTLWVSDVITGKIYNIRTDIIFSLKSSFATSVFDAGATSPQGISFAPDGTIWVCDNAANKIYNITVTGTLISSFADTAIGISFASNGTLWICDIGTNKIYNITVAGAAISEFATSVFDASATGGRGITYASDDTLWFIDSTTKKIYNITLTGTLISSFATSVYDASATSPSDISYAPDGTLWICDITTDKIYNITVTGTLISSFATSVYDVGATAPRGITYASDDTIWICDDLTDKIYNVQPTKLVTQRLVMGSNERLTGMFIKLINSKVNQVLTSPVSVAYRNNYGEYSPVKGIDDKTKSSIVNASLNKSGYITWSAVAEANETKRTLGGLTAYYYELSFSKPISDSVQIYYVAGVTASKEIKSYRFPLLAHDRLWLCQGTRESANTVICSSRHTDSVWNGADTTKFRFGDNSELTAGAELFGAFSSNLYQLVLFTKKNETWIVSGTNPSDWVQYPLSNKVGCVAPLTMQTTLLKTAEGESIVVAIFQGTNGIYMCDGRSITPIHEDIRDYFDRQNSNAINQSKIADSTAFIDSDNLEYHWKFAGGASTTLNKELVYDLKRGSWYELPRGTGKELQVGFEVEDTDGNKYNYGMLETGYMERLENGTTFDGSDMVFSFRMGDMAFQGIMAETAIRYIKLVTKAKATTSNNIAVTHYADSKTAGTTLNAISPANSGYRLADNNKGENVNAAVYHSLEFSQTTNDETIGFEPIALGILYEVIGLDIRNQFKKDV